jgi:lysophospholipase L1-like esterase
MRSGRPRVADALVRRVGGSRPRWWWLGLPVVPIQGYRLARTLPRFADADGVTGRVGSGDRRMKVVALGDSVTAGYAVDHHRSSVAGQLAVRLAERHGATVDWLACAETGATAGRALALVSPEALADADLVFVSIGVNDLKNLHSAARFRRELDELLDAILAAAPTARVCLLGIPPLDHFPAFPRPLADALGWRGRVFDAIGVAAVRARERTFRIETSDPLGPEMFAGDGFHPSPTLHAAFADAVMAGLSVPG